MRRWNLEVVQPFLWDGKVAFCVVRLQIVTDEGYNSKEFPFGILHLDPASMCNRGITTITTKNHSSVKLEVIEANGSSHGRTTPGSAAARVVQRFDGSASSLSVSHLENLNCHGILEAVAAKGVVELTEMPQAGWNFLLLHLHPQFFRIELEELVVDFLDSSLSFSP